MTIRVTCDQCGKTLTAPDSAAGRKGKCPKCGNVVTLTSPAPVELEMPDFESELPSNPDLAQDIESAHPSSSRTSASRPYASRSSPSFGGEILPPSPALDSRYGVHAQTSGHSRRHLYWLLALLFIPLAVSLLGGESDVEERLARTMGRHKEAIERLAENDNSTESQFFAIFPGQRIEGALLSHETSMHWVFALVAAAGFFAIALFLFDQGAARFNSMLGAALFTATVGIIALLLFQHVADWTQSFVMRGRSIVVLLFYIVKFIGFSYRCALDPDTGLFLSAVGFTFGVGLCEELIKALPVLWRASVVPALDWRGACVWGFISGVGFGVAEGVMYSGDYYNGVFGGDMYLVRFVSCVGLHAVWGASVAIAIVRCTNMETPSEFAGWSWLALRAAIVPMILHGFYDTLLKKEMNGLALVTALISLGWLAFLIEKSIKDQPDYEPEYA